VARKSNHKWAAGAPKPPLAPVYCTIDSGVLRKKRTNPNLIRYPKVSVQTVKALRLAGAVFL